ncbi:MAG: hypothetical protein V1921_05650 [Candidatus Altiarchaeota archaeon]
MGLRAIRACRGRQSNVLPALAAILLLLTVALLIAGVSAVYLISNEQSAATEQPVEPTTTPTTSLSALVETSPDAGVSQTTTPTTLTTSLRPTTSIITTTLPTTSMYQVPAWSTGPKPSCH